MTLILKGKPTSASAPAVVAVVSTPESVVAVSTPFPYKPPPKADGAIAAIVSPTGKSILSPISSHVGDAAITPRSTDSPISAAAAAAAAVAGVAAADKKKSVLPDYSHYTSPSALATTLSDYVLATVNRKHSNFNALGDLSGMTAQRPVIAAVTNFEPVLLHDVSPDAGAAGVPFTRMGKHLFEQFFVRYLVRENIDRLVKELQRSQVSATLINNAIGQFRANFGRSFRPVTDLFNALADIEQLKKSFEFKRYAVVGSAAFESRFHADVFATAVPYDVTTVRIADLFTSDFHFNETAFRNFTNTKVMFQLLYELQNVVKNHSYDLIRFDVTNHSHDESVVNIVKNTTVAPRYSIGYLERFNQLPITTERLRDIFKRGDIAGITKPVSDTFKRITAELPSNIIDRITLLSSLISKEFRCASSLHNPDFRSRLTSYGFDPDSTQNIIDQLVGDVPDKITDVLNPQARASLSNLLQIIDDNVAVLPFEQKYIDSENGTYTPGSVYLADSILDDRTTKFSTERLQKYQDTINVSGAALTDVMNQLHLINPAKYSPIGANRADIFFIRTLAEILRSSFSNGDLSAGILVGTQNEVLIATMAQAASDETLRSLLYALFTVDDILEIAADDISKTIVGAVVEIGLVDKISARVAEILNAHRAAAAAPLADYKRPPDHVSAIDAAAAAGVLAPLDGSTKSSHEIGDEEFRSAFASDQFQKMRAAYKKVIQEFVKSGCFDEKNVSRFSHLGNEVMKLVVFQYFIDITSRFTFAKFALTPSAALRVDNNTIKVVNFRILIDKLVVAPDMQKALQSIVAEEADSYEPQLRIIGRKLFDEEIAVKKCYLAIISTLASVQSKAGEIISLFDGGTGKYSRVFTELAGLVKPEMVAFIDAAQVRLALHQAQEIMLYSLKGNTSGKPIQFLDGSVIDRDAILAMVSLFAEKKFQQAKADNMRILTVGLPLGFSKQLQERISLGDVKDGVHLQTKQKDVVKFSVFKRDLEFPDLVFLPQTFVFELSRFMSTVSSFTDTQTKDDHGFVDFTHVLENVRSFDLSPEHSTITDDKTGEKGRYASVYTSAEYDFLSLVEKDELIRNHTISTLLEQYVRLLTGVTLNEQAFLLRSGDDITLNTLPDEGLLKSIIDEHVKTVANVTSFDSSTDSVDALNLPTETVNKLVHDLKHLSVLAFSRTTLANPVGEIKRALSPKLFERVFQLPVDPDDFLIDVKKTGSTQFGEEALSRLVTTGEIVIESVPATSKDSVADTVYRLSERNRKRGTVTLEQYFVTVETFLGTGV